MNKISVLSLVLGLAFASSAVAGNLHVFSAGTTAKASEVNENFASIDQRLTEVGQRVEKVEEKVERLGGSETGSISSYEPIFVNPGVYVYKNYNASSGYCDTRTSLYERDEVGNTIRTDTVSGVESGDCDQGKRVFDFKDGVISFVSIEYMNSDVWRFGPEFHDDVGHTVKFEPSGIVMWKPSFQAGESYSSIVENRIHTDSVPNGKGFGADVWITSYHPASGAVWGYGSGEDGHQNCITLKVSRPVLDEVTLTVYCPDVGPIASHERSGGNNHRWELVSYTSP